MGLTRRQWLAGAAGAAAGVGLGTLGGRRPAFAQGTPKRGGTLRVATVDKPVNMDPGFAQLYSSLQVYQNVFNKLVYVDEKLFKGERDGYRYFDMPGYLERSDIEAKCFDMAGNYYGKVERPTPVAAAN